MTRPHPAVASTVEPQPWAVRRDRILELLTAAQRELHAPIDIPVGHRPPLAPGRAQASASVRRAIDVLKTPH